MARRRRSRKTIEINAPEPLLSAVRSFETECVAACCGIEAFDFNTDHLLNWLLDNPFDLFEALEQLSEMQGEAECHHCLIVTSSTNIELCWDGGSEYGEFARIIRRHIVEAIERSGSRIVPHSEWLTSTVVGLARGVRVDRAFDRLPILADALEEAGCDHPDVLAHCRGPGPHARGCWVVDLILGKN